jgi:hypothetical protein
VTPHSTTFRATLAVILCGILTTTLIAQQQSKPLDRANLDTTCAPCRDFFRFANARATTSRWTRSG